MSALTEAVATAKLPKGEIVGTFYGVPLIFNENTHRYFWGRESLRSVTGILNRLDKPSLKQWVANVTVDAVKAVSMVEDGTVFRIVEDQLEACRRAYDKKREDAADIGKMVHKYAEAVLGGTQLPEITDEIALVGCKAFDKWLSKNSVKPISIERRLLSRDQLYAGTTDLYAIINGKLSILDFKTSKYIYDTHWLQAEAYALALEEETGVAVEECHIIRLDKTTGEDEAVCRPRSKDCRDAWLSLAQLDQVMRRIEASERKLRKEAA